MKKVYNKKGLIWLFSFLINFIAMMLIIIVGNPVYEMTDDFCLSQFITEGDYNFIFSNYFLVSALGFVQKIIYPLNAYTIISLLISLLSTTVITKIYVEKFDWKIASLFTLLIYSTFGVSIYLTVSFARYAALFSFAGIMSVIHYARQKKWIIGVTFGCVIALIGSLYRFQVFLSVFALGIAFVGALSFKDYFEIGKVKRKIIELIKIIFEPRRLVSAILIIVISFSLNIISKNINSSTEELQHFRQYTSARSAVWDYSIPTYEECKEEYDKIGIDKTDLRMLKYDMLDENGGLSLEQLNGIKQISSDYYSNQKSIVDVILKMIKNIYYGIYQKNLEAQTILLAVLVFLLYFLIQKKGSVLPPFIIALAAFVYYSYLWYNGRAPYRVVYGVMLGAVCSIMYLIDYDKIKDRFKENNVFKVILHIVIIAVSLGGLYLSPQHNDHTIHYPVTDSEVQMIEEIKKDSENSYEFFAGKNIMWGSTVEARDVFHVHKIDYESNYIAQPAVNYLSTLYNYQLEQFGPENLYANLLNDNVYAVFSKEASYSLLDGDRVEDFYLYMRDYLQKYYSNGKTVNVRIVKQYNDYYVYSYSLS